MTVFRQDLLLQRQELRQELVAQVQQTESDLRAQDAVAQRYADGRGVGGASGSGYRPPCSKRPKTNAKGSAL